MMSLREELENRFRCITMEKNPLEPLLQEWVTRLRDSWGVVVDNISRGYEHTALRVKTNLEEKTCYFWIHLFLCRDDFLDTVDGAVVTRLVPEMCWEDQAVADTFVDLFGGELLVVDIEVNPLLEASSTVSTQIGVVLTENETGFAILEVATISSYDEDDDDLGDNNDDDTEEDGGRGGGCGEVPCGVAALAI